MVPGDAVPGLILSASRQTGRLSAFFPFLARATGLSAIPLVIRQRIRTMLPAVAWRQHHGIYRFTACLCLAHRPRLRHSARRHMDRALPTKYAGASDGPGEGRRSVAGQKSERLTGTAAGRAQRVGAPSASSAKTWL